MLYPWHQQLDDDFALLKKEHFSLLQELKAARMSEMSEIKDAIKALVRRPKVHGTLDIFWPLWTCAIYWIRKLLTRSSFVEEIGCDVVLFG